MQEDVIRIKAITSFFFFSRCDGSSLLRVGFLYLWRAGATLCCGTRASHFGGFYSLLQSTGCIAWASVTVAHGLSCSMACGIFPDQGSNPYPLRWQADS